MKPKKKGKSKKSGIFKGYLIFTSVIAAGVIFAGAFFTAQETSEYVTFGTQSVTVKSLISGYTQAQGIFTEPLEKDEKNLMPEKAAEGLSFFLPAPAYGIYDLSVSIYEFGKDVMEAVFAAKESNGA